MKARRFIAAGLIALAFAASNAWGASATRTSSFEYDPVSGLLTKEVIEPDNSNLCLVTTYTYDAFGNKTGATTRNCNGSSGEAAAPTGDAVIETRTSTTAFAAGSGAAGSWSAGQFPTTSANALGHAESKEFDPRFGAVTKLTGPNLLVTTWVYDGFGRKTLETRSDGTQTEWTYVWCSGVNGGTHACPTYGKYLVQVTPKDSAGTQNGAISKTYLDALNREIRAETEGFDGTLVYKDTEYDSLGRLSRVSKPYYSGQTPLWTTFEYDILGRAIAGTEPATSSGTIKTTTTYNGLTVIVTVSNNGVGTNLPDGVTQTKTTRKNSQGQVDLVTDTLGNTIAYTYDPFGNLLTTNAGGVMTTLGYDLRGRKTSMADPDMGNWTYAYDALGQLKRQTDAKLQVTTMTYDKLGRMTSRTDPPSGQVNGLISNWTYDACTKGVGKPCQVTSDNGYVRTYTYDTQGRVATIVTTIDTSYTITYGYDANGRLAQTTYPTGFVTKNVYNARGYLWKVTDNSGTYVMWQANTVSATGKVLTESLGNGLTTTRGYDELDRMTSNVVGNGGGNVQHFTYAYDTIGNLTQRVDVYQNPDLAENFAYDRLNRLLQSSGAGLTTKTYSYSAVGNITYKSDVGTYNYPAPTATRPHAVSSITGTVNGFTNPTFTYDANGSMTSGAGRLIAYTGFNMPAAIGGVGYAGGTQYTYTYTYNADHERTRLIHSTLGTFIYLHPAGKGQLLYEKEIKPSTLTERKHYITAGPILVGVYIIRSDSTTDLRYFHHDHLGSLTLITNASGAQVERLAYEAFGKRRYPVGTDDPNNSLFGVTTDRGFTSHEHLDEIALIHMNGRVYDPVLGRFMTADPVLQFPDNLQSYNRYSYVLNNPLSYTDPSGYSLKKRLRKAFKKYARVIVAAVATWYTMGMASEWLITTAAEGFAATGVNSLSGLVTLGGEAGSLTALGSAGVGAAGGFAGGLVASGGDFEAALRAAAGGALLGGIDSYFGNSPTLQRSAARAIGSGVASEVQGGRFVDGFLTSSVNSAARYAYNNMVGYDVNAAPGENRPGDDERRQVYQPDAEGRLPAEKQGMNIVGPNKPFDGSWLDPIKQGGSLSRVLNMIPVVNAIGGLDDYWQNNLGDRMQMQDSSYFLLPVTIPGAVLITIPALLDRVPVYQPAYPFSRR